MIDDEEPTKAEWNLLRALRRSHISYTYDFDCCVIVYANKRAKALNADGVIAFDVFDLNVHKDIIKALKELKKEQEAEQ